MIQKTCRSWAASAIAFAAVSSFLLSTGVSAGDEDLLRHRKGDEGAVECCPSGGSGRCLSLLLRTKDPDEIHAACAAALMTGGSGVEAGSCHRAAGTTLMGIDVGNYRKQGWWQDGPPNTIYSPHTYPAAQVAASSDGCRALPVGADHVVAGWDEARGRCAKTGYKTVHLFISMARDHNDQYIDNTSSHDPWLDDDATAGRVYVARVNTPEDLQKIVGGILSRCEVIDHVLIAGHGSPGMAWIKRSEKDWQSIALKDFLTKTLSPCALAPHAKVQFTGCSQACGAATAESLRSQFESIYSDPRFQSNGYQTLDDVKVLLSTSTVYVENNTWFGDLFNENASAYPGNGLGIQYTMDSGKMKTDIPTSSVPACTDD